CQTEAPSSRPPTKVGSMKLRRKAAFSQYSGIPEDNCVRFLPELSREQSAVLQSFCCLPPCCPRDDAKGTRNAAWPRASRAAPASTRLVKPGEDRSMAGRTNRPATC